MDNVILNSGKVWLSEEKAVDEDALYAKFLVCDFSVNGNGVRLDRDTIDSWVGTLKDQPLVGKIAARSDGSVDFTGHNTKIVRRTDANGHTHNEVEFDTSAFGTFVDVGIESVDGVECIVATARVWKRFHAAAEIIEARCRAGNLHTSWEIAVDDAETVLENGGVVKIIHSGRFIGHCLLGRDVRPAYPNSGLLDVAEQDDDLGRAIILDMLSLSERKDVEDVPNDMHEEQQDVLVEQPVANTAEEQSPVLEQAELTIEDIRRQIFEKVQATYPGDVYPAFIFPETHTVWLHDFAKPETSFQSVDYMVTGNDVTLGNPVDVELTVAPTQVNNTFAQMQSYEATIAELNQRVEALDAYRQRCEEEDARAAQAEHDKAVSELRQYALDSGRFTAEELASEEMADTFNALDRAKVNSMIAERLVEHLRQQAQESADKGAPETAQQETPPIAPIFVPMDSKVDPASAVRNFIHG